MGTMFRSAVMNGIIPKHPMDGVSCTKPVRVPSDILLKSRIRFWKWSHNSYQYALIWETGLRTGEMIGMTGTASLSIFGRGNPVRIAAMTPIFNGAASKGQNPETLEKSRRFKEM